jgi:hypothetical protein
MPRLALPLLGIAVVFVVPALAQVPVLLQEPAGDETSPALLKVIQTHLAGTTGLRPSDGVRIVESKYFRGTVRIRGTVVSETQRDSLRRALESIRSRLETAADVKITRFDLSGLEIGPPPPSGKAPKESAIPESVVVPGGEMGTIFPSFPTRVVPYYYFVPVAPPEPPARNRCLFFRRSSDYENPNWYGPPANGMYYWWCYPSSTPFGYGYGAFPYPY